MTSISTRFALLFAVLFLGTAASTALAQETHDVHMFIEEVEGEPFPEFYFEPTGIYVEPGDTIRFIADSPHHTVTAVHEGHGFPTRVPEGVGPFSSPVIPIGQTWEYTFDEPGVYDLVCMPHFLFAMGMRVVVGEASGPAAEPIPEQAAQGEAAPVIVLLNAPALAPDRIIEEGTVSWSEIDDEHKTIPAFLEGVEVPEPEGGEAPADARD